MLACEYKVILALSVLVALSQANVLPENLPRSHMLHAAHRREMDMLWNVNDRDAPLVTGKTINLAREMVMAEAAEDAAAAAAKKAEDDAKHAEIRAKIVAQITEPFKDYNPLMFILETFWDKEIDKAMYPLF